MLAAEFGRLGFSVTLVTYHRSEMLQRHRNLLTRVSWIRISLAKRGIWGTLNRLKQVVEQRKPLAVIAYLRGSSFMAPIACQLARADTSVITSERSSFTNGRPMIRDYASRASLLLADHIVCNSREQCGSISRYMPWLKKKVKYIPNGISSGWFAGTGHPSTRGQNIIGVGRVHPSKDLSYFISAIASISEELRRRQVKVKWTGRIENKLYFDQIETEINQNSLHDIWVWNGEQSNMLDVYYDASLFVMTSNLEGMPNVLIEAMACGAQCLVRPVSDSIEILGGNSGSVCNGSPIEFGRRIVAILESGSKSSGITSDELRTLARRYSIEETAKKHLLLLADQSP